MKMAIPKIIKMTLSSKNKMPFWKMIKKGLNELWPPSKPKSKVSRKMII